MYFNTFKDADKILFYKENWFLNGSLVQSSSSQIHIGLILDELLDTA